MDEKDVYLKTAVPKAKFVEKKKKQLYPIAAERLEVIKKLRRETCAGIGECSAALKKAGGDYEKALEIVREVAKGPKVLD